jgi:hypothetical protein
MIDATSNVKNRSVLDIARSYLAAGISVVPVKRDGTKTPSIAWKQFQKRLPTDRELTGWFGGRKPFGIGTVSGRISGNLEQVDFDARAKEIFPRWCELVDAEQPGLSDSLHVVETPGGGYHAKFLCPGVVIPGNTLLASDPNEKRSVLIETRGEGGYCVAPGSPAECHPTGGLYQHIGGPDLPCEITPEQREILLRCARSFTREFKEPTRQVGLDLRPGDDFDRRGWDWSKILEPAGWKCVFQRDGVSYWRRPGKDGPGWSATTGYCSDKDGADLLRVFSSNADPFEVGKTYGRFRAFALLNHGGDLSAAADALARQGFGSRHASNGAAKHSPTAAPVETFTASDLMRTQLPETRWAIRGIIPEGLTILAGKPKLGKSWLALHAALAISCGGVALGRTSVEAGEVLYISLEDTKRRLQSRIRKLLAPGESPSPRLHLAREWPRQDKGGLKALDEWLASHPGARLVIIDTWGRWRPFRTGKTDSYETDYTDGAALKALADKYGVCILVVHHCRKLGAADALEEISGTVGLTGACDGACVLRRERGQHDATLVVSGRDVDEQELALIFDRDSCLWQVVGEAEDYRVGRETKTILDLFTDDQELSAKQVEALTGKSPSSVRQMLSRMAREGRLEATARGKYRQSAREMSQMSQCHETPFG